ncbi:small glutamine-rich tetratricopeptide repeat-containing protein [Reticulomyxa filosa]|uniref:Small glutamine-rich tetratricopeptide repeat-containing protein n=1 Tax=Reticulomyxa filosa TaxID=46433 RepID=X6P8Q9_RETFI|nr:small glutamine-rich tetratricopeptide repeat-containing protein [Reticulomyxa filosa]|eukprot:ETO34498.1 small glutamine-rich tetratricopeptide repeat-containing protein [Reticulomyxa filosa]
MSQLWPDGNDKSLLLAVIRYLEDLKAHKSVDNDNKDALGVAIDCLRSFGGENNDILPFTLEQLYEQYRDRNEKPQSKHRDRFLQFLSALHEKGYFKQVENDPGQYKLILEQARIKYNQRCPLFEVGPLESLGITKEEIEQIGKAGGAAPVSTAATATTATATATTTSDDSTVNKKKETNDSKPQTKKQENTTVEEKEVSAEAKKKAEVYKTEGNQLFASNQHKEAIAKYTSAIECDPTNAVYFCNRAAAYTHVKKHKALKLDNNYVKAYIRLGVAELERGNLEAARDAYQEAAKRTKTSDPSWDTYMERVEYIKQKIELEKNKSSKPSRNANPGGSSGAGGDGGLGNWMDGLSQMGGGAGGGLGGLAGLLNNPMMQQMAQQMMSNPEMMQQMSEFMNNPDSMSQIQNIVGDPNFQNIVGDAPNTNSAGNSDGNSDDASAMQDVLYLY